MQNYFLNNLKENYIYIILKALKVYLNSTKFYTHIGGTIFFQQLPIKNLFFYFMHTFRLWLFIKYRKYMLYSIYLLF